jgi:hypothetical protein
MQSLDRGGHRALGKAHEVHALMWGIAGLFIIYFLRGALEMLV